MMVPNDELSALLHFSPEKAGKKKLITGIYSGAACMQSLSTAQCVIFRKWVGVVVVRALYYYMDIL